MLFAEKLVLFHTTQYKSVEITSNSSETVAIAFSFTKTYVIVCFPIENVLFYRKIVIFYRNQLLFVFILEECYYSKYCIAAASYSVKIIPMNFVSMKNGCFIKFFRNK